MMKKIRQGNTINLRYTLYRVNGEDKVPEDLTGVELRVELKNNYFGTKLNLIFEVSANAISTTISGQPLLKTGLYNLALYYSKDGQDHAIDVDAFEIVDRSSKIGGATCCPDMEVETVELAGEIEYNVATGTVDQIQSDWNESNTASKAFIRNKPELKKVATTGSYKDLSDTPNIPVLPEGIVIDPNYVHTDNNFTNDQKEKLQALSNYDDTEIASKVVTLEKEKANTIDVYTKVEVDDKIESAGNFDSTKYYDKNATDSLLSGKADTSSIPSKVSQLTNDTGYISDYVETDPTVPNWAKQNQKPTYTASEVGALPDSTFIPSVVNDLNSLSTVDALSANRGKILNETITASKIELQQSISNKANRADVYTKDITYNRTEVDNKLTLKADVASIPDVSVLATKAEVTTGLATKSDKSDTYTKQEVDDKISGGVGTEVFEFDILPIYGILNYNDTVDLGVPFYTELRNAIISKKEILFLLRDSTNSIVYTNVGLQNRAGSNYISSLFTFGDHTYKVEILETGIASAFVYKYKTVVYDGLDWANTTVGLSANQGRILNETKQNIISIDESYLNLSTSPQSIDIYPNTFYKFGSTNPINLNFIDDRKDPSYKEFMFEFNSGSIATTLTLTSVVKWMNEPVIEANHTYQVSIVNNIAVIGGVSNE